MGLDGQGGLVCWGSWGRRVGHNWATELNWTESVWMLIYSFYLYMIAYHVHKVLVAHSCLSLCDPMDYSLTGPSVHGLLQARTLEWVAMPLSRGLPDPGIEPWSPALQVVSLLIKPPEKPHTRIIKEKLNLIQQIEFECTYVQLNC